MFYTLDDSFTVWMTGALSRWGSCQCLLSPDESLCCVLGGWVATNQATCWIQCPAAVVAVAVAAVTEVSVCVCGGYEACYNVVCHSLHSNPHALWDYIK